MSVVLPVDVPPATRMFVRSATALRSSVGLVGRHDAGRDIVVEREDRDGGLADREGRRRDDGRQQALEPLARFGQLGRDARGAGMDLGADMMRDEADDALAVGRRQHARRCRPGRSTSRSIHSRPSGLSITSTMRGIFQKRGDRRARARCAACARRV